LPRPVPLAHARVRVRRAQAGGRPPRRRPGPPRGHRRRPVARRARRRLAPRRGGVPRAALALAPLLMGKTLAIFGGSFNPPHVAHQMACLYVLETQPVDHLICMPAFLHPFDKALAPFGDRVEMCRLLVAPLGERASVSTLEEELDDGRTLVLVEALRAREPEATLRLVIGADILRERDKWW